MFNQSSHTIALGSVYLSEESTCGKFPSVAAVEVLKPRADDIAQNLRVPGKDLQHVNQLRNEVCNNISLAHRFHPKELHARSVCARLVQEVIKDESWIVFHESGGKSKVPTLRR